MMTDIREQIADLRERYRLDFNDMPMKAADTMQKLIERNELLEAVFEAAEAFLQSEDKQGKFSAEYQWKLEEAVDDTNIHR